MTISSSRRQALRAMGALALGLGGRELAFGAVIVAVRVWPADEYTRVTIESDAPLAEKHFLAENPARLVIDVDGQLLSVVIMPAEAVRESRRMQGSGMQGTIVPGERGSVAIVASGVMPSPALVEQVRSAVRYL